MEKKNEALGASFTLPDRVTVRMQLEYFSASAGSVGKEMVEKFWDGAKTLIENWQCADMPDMNIDLDKVTDPKITNIILWVGLEVRNFVSGLDSVPKN